MKWLSLVFSRIVEGALLALGVVVFVTDGITSIAALALWDVLAVVYLVSRVRRVTRADRQGGSSDWLGSMLGKRIGLLFTLFTSLVGITAGLMIVITDVPAEEQALAKAFAVPAVLFAWAILHFGYAERYAQAYYAALPEKILIFPNTPEPNFRDFAYFSFTLGTSFAVSDVETNASRVRSKILAHSVLAFVYNTATLGVAIGVITGK
ncbi:Uncharacterized membrane protein [Actinokineospora alba]|uniref:Uncharacterized membrane protein n=1 Tax=Actinokineospora alba TaxID=504798 RepID=A0A1H0LV90_9PSEU|nr:putative membrane protein [Actinokineospora alba]SDI47429.1 Uncharacterized membrane protein [Actinokineospora alba]SDO72108.1 Uncharacterized membrane protein [Actinokineospora alba]